MNDTRAQAHPAPTHTIFGNTVRVLADGAATGGAFAVLEYACAPRFRGPAPHWHARTEEAFYVLEGTLTFWLGDAPPLDAAPGAFVRVPPGLVHRFANESDRPVRFLCFLSPGGFEGYFADLAELAASEPSWPPAEPGKLERLTAKYDLHPPLNP